MMIIFRKRGIVTPVFLLQRNTSNLNGRQAFSLSSLIQLLDKLRGSGHFNNYQTAAAYECKPGKKQTFICLKSSML